MVKKLLKTVLAGIVLLFLVGLVHGYQTKKKLVRYCDETTAGTLLSSTKQKALQNGFRFYDNDSRKKALVTASGVMGRYVCQIEHDGNKVVKASLLFND